MTLFSLAGALIYLRCLEPVLVWYTLGVEEQFLFCLLFIYLFVTLTVLFMNVTRFYGSSVKEVVLRIYTSVMNSRFIKSAIPLEQMTPQRYSMSKSPDFPYLMM